jgi:uncharacterized membrane protein YsdA (DUF1294 family)
MGRKTRGKRSPPEPPLPPPRVDWGGPRPGRRTDPTLFHGLVGLGLAAAGAVLLWWGLNGSWSWEPWAAAWLASINVTTFGYYAWDKVRARSANRRVPEVVLHGLALVGGSVGAYLGMRLFRHKTIKGTFRILFWAIVALQATVIVWLVKVFWFGGSS